MSGAESSLRKPDFPFSPFASLLNLFSNNCNSVGRDSSWIVVTFSLLFVTFYICMVIAIVKISEMYNITEEYDTSDNIKKNIDITYGVIVTIAVFMVLEILFGINFAENLISSGAARIIYVVFFVVGLAALVLYLLIGQFILKWSNFKFNDEKEGDRKIKNKWQYGTVSKVIGIICTISYGLMIFITIGKGLTTSTDSGTVASHFSVTQ